MSDVLGKLLRQVNPLYARLLDPGAFPRTGDKGEMDTEGKTDSKGVCGAEARGVCDGVHAEQQADERVNIDLLRLVYDELYSTHCGGKGVSQMDNQVERPSHYTQGTVEAWDVMQNNLCRTDEAWIDYLVCTAYKYLHRAPHKGEQKQDYEKAVYCLKRAIDTLDKRSKYQRNYEETAKQEFGYGDRNPF